MGDPPTPESLREARKYARATIAEVAGRLRRVGDPRIAVASSKTFKQLARMAGAAPSAEGMYVPRSLSLADLQDWVPRLTAMTAAERSRLPGVSEGRAEQLVAGAIVAEAAMDLLDIRELVICPWALREGVILHRMDTLPT
jgi:exopolyphosphatase/guanosine-5'-triphosphate,3'-diphosphate pyrophosphatase